MRLVDRSTCVVITGLHRNSERTDRHALEQGDCLSWDLVGTTMASVILLRPWDVAQVMMLPGCASSVVFSL